MPCKIEIKHRITSIAEKSTDAGLAMSLENANKLANEVNKGFGIKVVSFNRQGDYINRDITVPDILVDDYYNSEKIKEEVGNKRIIIDPFDVEQINDHAHHPENISV